MKNLMRSLFGFDTAGTTRQVVGKSAGVDLKDVAYIRDSSKRLSQLYSLAARYAGTPYEQKLRAVWDKTKAIHEYLIAKNRVHELELFHLQNTDHFISTYTTIWDAHHKQAGKSSVKQPPELLTTSPLPRDTAPAATRQRRQASTDMVRPVPQQSTLYTASVADTGTPRLLVADVVINTFSKIAYRQEEPTDGNAPYEVGCTSTPFEKEAFLQYLSDQTGLSGLSYVGNALVSIPNSNGSQPTGLVPVITWGGFMYAVNLNDYRLFPVKIYRKSS